MFNSADIPLPIAESGARRPACRSGMRAVFYARQVRANMIFQSSDALRWLR